MQFVRDGGAVLAVVEEIVDRPGVAAFVERFLGEERGLAMAAFASVEGGMVLAGTGFGLTHPDADEPRLLEEGVDVSHLREGLDPRESAELARAADERGGEAGAAVGGVDYYALQEHDRLVEDAQGGAVPDAASAEELIPQLE